MRICSKEHVKFYCRFLGNLCYINPTPSAAWEFESSSRIGQLASSWVSTHLIQQLVLINHCSMLYWGSKHSKHEKKKKSKKPLESLKFKQKNHIYYCQNLPPVPTKALKLEICMSYAETPQMEQNTKQLFRQTKKPAHSSS